MCEDGGCVLGEFFGYPVCVFFLELRHDDDFVAALAAEGGYIFNGAMLEGVLPGGADVGCHVVLVPEVFELIS